MSTTATTIPAIAPAAKPACAGAGVALGVTVAVGVGVAIMVLSWVTIADVVTTKGVAAANMLPPLPSLSSGVEVSVGGGMSANVFEISGPIAEVPTNRSVAEFATPLRRYAMLVSIVLSADGETVH